MMANRMRMKLPDTYPEESARQNKKQMMYNDVIKTIESSGLGFDPDQANLTGKQFVQAVTNGLWYVDLKAMACLPIRRLKLRKM